MRFPCARVVRHQAALAGHHLADLGARERVPLDVALEHGTVAPIVQRLIARVASTRLVERAAMPNPSVILGPEDCLRHGAVRSSASHRVLPSPPAAGCCKDTRPKTPRCCRVTKAGRSNRKKGGYRHRPRRDGHLSSAHPSSHPVPCGRAGRRPSGSRGGPEGNRRICDGRRRAAADRTILDSIRRSREPGSIGVWTSDRNFADTLRPLGAAVNSGERVDITAW